MDIKNLDVLCEAAKIKNNLIERGNEISELLKKELSNIFKETELQKIEFCFNRECEDEKYIQIICYRNWNDYSGYLVPAMFLLGEKEKRVENIFNFIKEFYSLV